MINYHKWTMENCSWYNATMPDVFMQQPRQQGEKTIINSLDTLKEGKLSFFTNYCELPDGVTYEGKDADETTLLFLRRDFVTNVPWIITTLIACILPFVIALLLKDTSLLNNIPQRYILIITAFYYVLVLGYAVYSFINWFYNISLVTERDIVDVDYSNVTYKNIALATYEAIQDVEYVQSGFLRNFFDYGDVFVQTAGQRENIELLMIPKPGRVADVINDQKKKRFNGGVKHGQP